MSATGKTLAYRRSRFSARLPVDRRYTAAHYWLFEEADGVWRVGFTTFATRMLGDLVEYEFSLEPEHAVQLGQELGWVEGFKAVTTVYSVVDGAFLGSNEALRQDITLVETDPFGRGWLYGVRGRPDPAGMDVHGYAALLDSTIDKLLESRHAPGETQDDS